MKRFALLIPALAVAALTASTNAASLTINPSADAFVTTGPSNDLTLNNYGAAGALEVSAPGSAKGEFQSVLRFDLSGTVNSFNSQFGAGNWTVDSVTLLLTVQNPVNAIFNTSNAGSFSMQWMANDGWTEGSGTPMNTSTTGLTFATLPNFLGASDAALGTFTFDGATSGTRTLTLSLAGAFTSDLMAGGLVSMRMFAASGSTVSFLSNSNNFTMPAARPVLTISASAVPEPGTAFLLAVGGGFALSRRPRRAAQA